MPEKPFIESSLWRLLRLEVLFSLYYRLTLWSFSVARARGASWWIMFFAYLEGIFFPIPPDAFLLARGVAQKQGLLLLAFGVTICSVLGGLSGYLIGAWFFEKLGIELLALLGLESSFERVLENFSGSVAFWTVFLFGFTFLPFKAIALASGVAAVPLPFFLLAAFVSRGARFIGLAILVYLLGEPLQRWLQSRQAFLLSLLVAVVGLLLLVLYASDVFSDVL